MDIEVRTIEEFRYWVQVQMAIRQTNQHKLATKWEIPYPRISEAVNGKPAGRRYIIPLIEELGGDMEKFAPFLQTIKKRERRKT